MLILSLYLSKFPYVSPDSGGYITNKINLIGLDLIIDDEPDQWGNLSFLGESFRSWPTVLLYAIFNDNFYRVLLQNIIYLMSLFFLIKKIDNLFNPNFYSKLIILLGFSIIIFNPTSISMWIAIGPESLASSLVNLVIALSLNQIILRESSDKKIFLNLVMLWIVSITLVTTRFSFLFYILIPTIVTYIYSRKRKGKLRGLIISLILLTLSLFYFKTIQENQNRAWGTFTSEIVYRFLFQLNDPFPHGNSETFRSNLPPNAPKCLINYPQESLDWNGIGNYAEKYCKKDGVAWIEDNYERVLLSHYINSPKNTSIYFQEVSRAAVTNWIYPGVESPIPEIFHTLTFNSRGDTITHPGFIYVLIILIFLYYYYSTNRVNVNSAIITTFGLIILSGFFLSFVDIADSAARKAFPGYYGVLLTCVIILIFLNEKHSSKKKEI